MSFVNQGEGPLHQLHVASKTTNIFAFDGATEVIKEINNVENNSKSTSRLEQRISKIPLPKEHLYPGATAELTMWAQGCGQTGTCLEDLLFYYESTESDASMRCDVFTG